MIHFFKRRQSQNDGEPGDDRSCLILVNHELLEGVEIRRDEGADGLVVVVEDLLPSAL